MRKSYALEDLDCANCAAKMEAAINKLPEVEKATVSFMTSRMSLVVPEGTDMTALLEKIQKEISKVEPDCRVVVK
ncbi:MAG: heavy metal-associated domain-containing protein [Candidatus Faecousia sp.]|nr:heavy metal-associated domain-containing protein [Bacillota bacterium]MDY4219547.1 heavy metal-associated domain-containing protein [Candidatus Faecousia sp.]